jgi:hypothetical protein
MKEAHSKIVPSTNKEPKSQVPSYNDRNPAWRVRHIQMVDPYGWHQLSRGDIGKILDKLKHFESKTWNEILVIGKKFNHSIAVEKFRCNQAKKWMGKHMPDQHELWTLRVSGKERVWGILSEGVYQILFWDPHHLICKCNL